LDISENPEVLIMVKEWLYEQDDKRKWLRSLRVAFAKADACGKGSVDMKGMAKVLQETNVVIHDGDLDSLVSILNSSAHEGELHYPHLLRLWDITMSCPQEDGHTLIKKLLHYVGKTSTMRLRWVRRFRKQCLEADKYRGGLLEPEIVQSLLNQSGGGDALNSKELKALTDAFVTEDMEGVAYRYLLRTLSQVSRPARNVLKASTRAE